MSAPSLFNRLFDATRAALRDEPEDGTRADAVFRALFPDRAPQPAHRHHPDPASTCRVCAEAGLRAEAVEDEP